MSVQVSIFYRFAYVLFSFELPLLTLNQLSQVLKQTQEVRVDRRELERFEPLTVGQFVSVPYFENTQKVFGACAGTIFFLQVRLP